MARIHRFRKLTESIEQGNVFDFQKIFKEKLEETLHQKQDQFIKSLIEEIDQEQSIVNKISNSAKSFGGSFDSYNDGVVSLSFPNKKATQDFADYLDSDENVDSYDIYCDDGSSDDDKATSLQKVTDYDADECTYTFDVYLNPENVNFSSVSINEEKEEDEEDIELDDEETDEDEDEEDMDEACKSKKSMKEDYTHVSTGTSVGLGFAEWLIEAKKEIVVRAGKKVVKMSCPIGQQWDDTNKKCVVMTSQEVRKRHLAGIKAAKKRLPKIAKIEKRKAFSLKKRAQLGLNV